MLIRTRIVRGLTRGESADRVRRAGLLVASGGGMIPVRRAVVVGDRLVRPVALCAFTLWFDKEN